MTTLEASKNVAMKARSVGFALAAHDAGVDLDLGPHGFCGLRCGIQALCCLVAETALLQMLRAQNAVALDAIAGSYQYMVSIHLLQHL